MSKIQSFAGLLKEARRAEKLTQSQLSMKSGISVDTIRGWEQGRYEPDFNMFCSLFAALGSSGAEIRALLGSVSADFLQKAHEDGYYKLREDLEKIISSVSKQ